MVGSIFTDLLNLLLQLTPDLGWRDRQKHRICRKEPPEVRHSHIWLHSTNATVPSETHLAQTPAPGHELSADVAPLSRLLHLSPPFSSLATTAHFGSADYSHQNVLSLLLPPSLFTHYVFFIPETDRRSRCAPDTSHSPTTLLARHSKLTMCCVHWGPVLPPTRRRVHWSASQSGAP